VTDKPKSKTPAPQVQVIRKPMGAPVTPGAVAPAPVVPIRKTVAPTPVARPTPAHSSMAAPLPPRPSGPVVSSRPAGSKPAFRGPPRSSGPRTPPTPEAIAVLAQKERVPARIAKGELEGKMKCRIWKKLHAEEAKRFEQAWTLAEKTPGLELADAFGIVQSGMTVEEYRARRARARKRESIKEARADVAPEVIDAFINARIAEKTELCIVMGERTAIDVITEVQPVSFTGERSGKIEKLHVVALSRKSTWESITPKLERDSKLAQKPAQVSRQPSRRPVSDPRAFVEHQGKRISVQLRNGIKLTEPLLAVGPFDVLLGAEGNELFVPLHAMLSWSPAV